MKVYPKYTACLNPTRHEPYKQMGCSWGHLIPVPRAGHVVDYLYYLFAVESVARENYFESHTTFPHMSASQLFLIMRVSP